MRPWAWGILGGFAGLFAGFAITVAIGLVAFDVFRVSSREGAAAMGLVFMVGPLGALIGAAIGAAFAVWFARRSLTARGGTPAATAPRTVRLVVAVLAGGILGYWLGLGLLHLALALRGSRSFDSYAIAYALSNIPVLTMLACAGLGAWIVLRRRSGQA